MNMETTNIQKENANVIANSDTWQETRELLVASSSNATEKDLAFAVEIGKIQALQSIATVSKASIVQWFKARKEQKDYRNVQIMGKNGLFVARNFDELCEGMGFTYQEIFEEIKNYEALGTSAFEQTKALGISRAKMRDFRSVLTNMTEEEREIAEKQFNTADADALRDWIDDLLVDKRELENDKKQAIESGNKAKVQLEKIDKELLATKRELNEYKNPSGKLAQNAEKVQLQEVEKELVLKMQQLKGLFTTIVEQHRVYLDLAIAQDNTTAYSYANEQLTATLSSIHDQLQDSRFDVDFAAILGFDYETSEE